MNRFFGRLTRTVTKPWQMYPIGVLFGLGFDTATEVALLVLAGGAAGAGLPWYAILCLPILFAAGMSLLDTIDGSFMNFAYGWAFSKPVRKVFYNLTITGLSVAVALVIGTIELGGLLAAELNLLRARSGVGSRTSTSTCSGSSSSACSSPPGRSRWRSGGSGRIEERWSAHLDTSRESRMTDRPRRPRRLAVFETSSEAIAALRARGLRLSTRPPAGARGAVRGRRPGVAPTLAQTLALDAGSVYRNLEVLERHGLVRHVHLGHGPGLYVLVGRDDGEYLYCERCGKVTALDPDQLAPVREHIKQNFGHTARFTHFAIVGLCERCSKEL